MDKNRDDFYPKTIDRLCMLSKEMKAKILELKTVVLDESIGSYPIFHIKNQNCTASIALHGAHLFNWQPKGQKPVIYTSPEAVFKLGKAIRGGVPVCWPWFNAHPIDETLPSHGFVRNRFWNLESVEESSESTTLVFSLESNTETRKLWEASFQVTLRIVMNEELEISLTTKNSATSHKDSSNKDVITLGGALHTYLAIGCIDEVEISGLDSTSYIDTVGEEQSRVQQGEITIEREIDRIYMDTASDIILHDYLLKRKVRVSRKGSLSAVIWNPWVEKAKALADLPDKGYQDFVCIEAANAREDVYPLAPGESHTLATRITVE